MCTPWFHNELAEPDVSKFVDLAHGRATAAILAEATSGDPSTSARWEGVLRPEGLDPELRAAFTDHQGCWGVVTLHREAGRPGFERPEADLLTRLGPVVADGLRRITVLQQALTGDLDGPGLVLIRPDGEVTPGTEAGARWLEQLVPPQGHKAQASLLTLRELVTSGLDHGRRVKVRARDGRWVTLHAAPMLEGDGTLVVVIEPSRPADIAALIGRAYGLSDRELEVALAVARGESTEGIAGALHISPHTVRDHLKSTFAKTNTAGRTELVGRLFIDHYASRLFADVDGH